MSPYCLSDGELESLLLEDSPCGDATTFALGISSQPGRLVFRSRYEMVVCGSEEALRLGQLCGVTAAGPIRVSGERLAAGEEILCLEGEAAKLHRVWKTAQTLMEYLSGIATCAADIVVAARRANPQIGIACTRKNFPGTKAASIKAVLCSGASAHRLSLSETLLIFAEHRIFLGDEPPASTVQRLRRQWPERAVVVEVSNEDEAKLWQQAGADILQLEKMSPEMVHRIKLGLPTTSSTRLAAAGGVNLANAEAYARAGADLLVTSAPYFAPPRDVAVSLNAL